MSNTQYCSGVERLRVAGTMEGSPEDRHQSIRIFEVPESSGQLVSVLTVCLAAHQTTGFRVQTPPAIQFSQPMTHWCNISLPMARACLPTFRIHQRVAPLILRSGQDLRVTHRRLPHIIRTQDIPMAMAKIPSRKWTVVPTNKKGISTYSIRFDRKQNGLWRNSWRKT